MIAITGPGRSGTSFLAELYRSLGFDPGGGWDRKVRAGREQHEVVEVNTRIYKEMEAPDGPPPITNFGAQRWDLIGELAERHGPTLRELAQRLPVAKDPRFCWTLRVWLVASAPIEHVVVSMRRLDEVQASARHAGMAGKRTIEEANQARSDLVYRVGSLFTTLGDHDVRSSVLWFPDYLERPESLYEQLVFPRPVELDGFLRAYRKTVKPERVNFGKVPQR